MPEIGNGTYTANVNDALNLVEKFAEQHIASLKTTNRYENIFPTKEIENGVTIEEAIIKMAEPQVFDPSGVNLWQKKVPQIVKNYFSTWDEKQFIVSIEKDEIRKITLHGKSAEDVAGEAIDSLTQGSDAYDEKEDRKLLTTTGFYKDYTEIFGRTPTTLQGALTMIRDAFNHLRALNSDATPAGEYESKTLPSDIVVAIPSRLANLFDVKVWAELYNKENAEIFGNMFEYNTDDLAEGDWYKVKVFDKKAIIKRRRIFDYEMQRNVVGRFAQHVLTTDTLRGLCGLFKAVEIDCTVPATTALNEITAVKNQ